MFINPKVSINQVVVPEVYKLHIISNMDSSIVSFYTFTDAKSVEILQSSISNESKNEIMITDSNGSSIQIIIANAAIYDSTLSFMRGGMMHFKFKGHQIT